MARDWYDVNSHRGELNDITSVCGPQNFKGLRLSIIGPLYLRCGFLYALKCVLRLSPGSLLWGGVPCSLLIFISRGTSKRNVGQFDLMGDPNSEATVLSNRILSRFALLVLIAICRDVWWACEQPQSSLLPATPYFAYLLNLAKMNPIFIRMSGP